MKTADHFEKYSDVFSVSFEPDRYSAVKVKFKPAEDMKQITASIFSTGKIIITGAETLKEIAFGYNIINQHISECKSICVSKTPSEDTFNIFSGYDIEKTIAMVRELKFNSWINTASNRQINF
jgi:TATA-box binding protein (TBP) (component of TFIID and TFIIIB)|tara:strand:+ start:91 stop:459 length:369 start_codon:yes stop_codon:yes gene_type:complete